MRNEEPKWRIENGRFGRAKRLCQKMVDGNMVSVIAIMTQ